MNKARLERIIRSLAYRKPMSSEVRPRQISGAQKTAAVLYSKIVPEHNAKFASRRRELLSKGVQLIYVDLKGHEKPDLTWFGGKSIVSEDVKSTGHKSDRNGNYRDLLHLHGKLRFHTRRDSFALSCESTIDSIQEVARHYT